MRIYFSSCDAQYEKVLAYIKSQEDLEVYKVYNDPGFSAPNLQRPALDTCVLAYKIDRLTCSPKDFYILIEFFDKYNISFISTTQHFDTTSAYSG